MARRTISIDEKIEQQKRVVFQAKARYDRALAELDELQKKRDEVRKKELMPARYWAFRQEICLRRFPARMALRSNPAG